jgi:hypothetical protein
MTATMTNDQILSAAISDIDNKIERGVFYGNDAPEDDNEHGGDWENFHTITSLYAQWSDDPVEAEQILWDMYQEKYSQYF